jgi:hypothetical protein
MSPAAPDLPNLLVPMLLGAGDVALAKTTQWGQRPDGDSDLS